MFKQWISSSLQHYAVPRVSKLYCVYLNNPQTVLRYGIVQVVNGRSGITYSVFLLSLTELTFASL